MNCNRHALIPRLALMFGLSCLSIACGSGNPAVYPVHGELFINGQPAPGAVVVLHPRDKEKMRPAYATVQADGTFKMSTYAHFDGASPGEYIITVSWCDERQEEEEKVFSADKLGDRYSRPESSDLKTTVQSSKNILPRLDLK